MSCVFVWVAAATAARRLSGLELLLVLVNRVGNQKMSAVDSDKRLIMEAIRKF